MQRPIRVIFVLLVSAFLTVACTASPAARPDGAATATAEETPASPDETTSAPTQSAETAAPDESGSSDEFMARLLSMVPVEIVDSCQPPTFTTDAIAQVECNLEDSGADWVSYALYLDNDAMNEEFDDWTESLDADPNADCQETPSAIGEYSIGDQQVGRVVCTPIGEQAWMRWTDERLSVLSSALRNDGDHEALYEWWTGNSGPVLPE